MAKEHNYNASITWTGNKGRGTESYKVYDRSYIVTVEGKPLFEGSSDPAFLGDPSKYNPEDLFLASISSCHMLWYLHLCSVHGITVTAYRDDTHGVMAEHSNGPGRFTSVTLRPSVTILEGSKSEEAIQLHYEANQKCFIANSLNFEVKHKPHILIED